MDEFKASAEELIAREAANWVQRLKNASRKDQEEFARWLRESRAHVRAIGVHEQPRVTVAKAHLDRHGSDRYRRSPRRVKRLRRSRGGRHPLSAMGTREAS